MVINSFEGQIRKVWQINERWLVDIYGTKNKECNGVCDKSIVQEAKELTRIPQVLTMITMRDEKVIRVEQLE